MKEARKGFTLIELLVVIAIIALLSSVVLASLSTARMKARDAKRMQDLRQIAVALSMYSDANGNFPETTSTLYNQNAYVYSYNATWDLLQAKLAPYLAKLPVDPINNSCPPWTNPAVCYAYSYGNVGNGNYSVSNSSSTYSYDLVARLETPGHPLTCGQTKFPFYFNKQMTCPNGVSQIYDGSLD